MATYQQHPSSFRDPSGFVFELDGKVYRQVHRVYQSDYELLRNSGLLNALQEKKWLIDHEEIRENITGSEDHYLVLQPKKIPFINYPSEWCFNQLKDAAILTLDILEECISKGMILKDASPYNVQFINSEPVFIDTLSFTKYNEAEPWIAYRQFCEFFLNPLLIAKYSGLPISKLFLAYPSGIPASVASTLLPWSTKLNLGIALHVHMQAAIKGKKSVKAAAFNKPRLLRIILHLQGIIKKLKAPLQNTAWNNYYEETILSAAYLEAKKKLVSSLIEKSNPRTALDLGSNEGVFANLLAQFAHTIAVDSDEACINSLYDQVRTDKAPILPLCIDLTEPPGNAGWNNEERKSFVQRVNPDLTLALALVHHLCLAKNISLERLVDFFSFCNWLIIEFVPKEDPKAKQLLASREDIFSNYSKQNFESVFQRSFEIIEQCPVDNSERIIYLMKKKGPANFY